MESLGLPQQFQGPSSVGNDVPPSHSGDRLGSSVSFWLFFKTKTYKTRGSAGLWVPWRGVPSVGRGGTEPGQLLPGHLQCQCEHVGRAGHRELRPSVTVGPSSCCPHKEPTAGCASQPVPNSCRKGTGKRLISSTLPPSPPHPRLESKASESLAFQRSSKVFSAIDGLWGGHLCPPQPQLFLAHAAGQLVKGRLVLLVEEG